MPNPSNSDLVGEALELSSRATPGPWTPYKGIDRRGSSVPKMIYAENLLKVAQSFRPDGADAEFIARARTLLPELAQQLEQARAENGRLRGWPEIKVGAQSPAHSPVDRYRCENPDCPEELSVWEFRPDDYDLDESVVNCPACGEEGELFFRWFRGGAALTPDEGADPGGR